MKMNSRHHGRMLVTFIIVFAFLHTFPVLAAAPPNSGTVLEGAKPPSAVQPPAEQKGPVITVEGQEPAIQSGGQQKIPVNGFRIGGDPPLPADELLGLIKSEGGKDLTLGQLDALAGQITQYLRRKGYPVAFAYIPAQTIRDGVVEIAVVPGKYGEIKITGDGHFDRDRLRAMLHTASPGAVITQEPLERALLLVSDLRGLAVKATLSPGQATGTADLALEVADSAKLRGTLYADNWGNRYTGRSRLGVQFTADNVGGRGDDLSLGGLRTEDSLMSNYNLGYSAPLGFDGARASVRHSRVTYTLGDSFADLGATGQATVTGGDLTYPFIRGRAFSLYGTLGYDDKRLRDDVSTTDTHSPKTSRLAGLGLSGSFADTWLGGGNNSFAVTHYQGRLTLEDATTAANDATTARTAGDFARTVVTFQRQQYVAENLGFHLNFTGQLAGQNLDSSEKLFLGGADGVRAFPQGEAGGDQGYKATGELRRRLPGLSNAQNSVHLAGFLDYGSVIVNAKPWAGAGDNSRSLMGAGLGLLWTHSSDFSLRLDYAWKIGEEAATAGADAPGWLWLQAIKFF